MLDVAIVGARRTRQGTGPFVARELARLGCRVRAVVGTSPASVDAARSELSERYGLRCAGYTSLEELLAGEAGLEALAICSPSQAHLPQLERAVAAGLHVLAEKPLWWSDDLLEVEDPEAAVTEAVRRAAALADQAAARGRTIHLNAQWPDTLPAFDALYPGRRAAAPRRFAMWLSPTVCGPEMLIESASHLVSMLQALAGPGRIEGVEGTPLDAAAEQHLLRCSYRPAAGEPLQAELRLRRCPSQPRPAGYAIDGAGVERELSLPDYTFSFRADDGRRVPAEDPLARSVARFVRSARAGDPPDRVSVVAGQEAFLRLVLGVCRREFAWPSR